MTTALTPSKYDKLITDLTAILEKGRQTALSAVNQIKLETYWKMGERMAEAQELADPDQASSLMSRLSENLDMDLPLLYRIQQFYRLWPDEVPVVEGSPTLSWSHFVEILSIKDPKERLLFRAGIDRRVEPGHASKSDREGFVSDQQREEEASGRAICP